MKKSKAAVKPKPPPKPTSMPKTGSQYATIPAGSFRIGSLPDEEGASSKDTFKSTVTLTRPFLMKTTEVTQAEWYFVMGEPTESYDKACGLECPVGHVSWRRAIDYLNAISKKEGLEPCYAIQGEKVVWTQSPECTGYRLPTEAEWEYAARGGTDTARYGEIGDIAWYYDNSDGKHHPVGKKAANAYGLHDMLGNQWEWTWDVEDYKSTPFEGEMNDPIIGGLEQEEAGQNRILRGGNYKERQHIVRAAHRYQYPAGSDDAGYGFRPMRTVLKK
ncbi:formylglycine-generating enzyme family protein [Corallococcus exiguus]|uniref:formylglycine-generating enzyme family protein n=1 Tax=Corallococcus exiguus TaxID=83462 RepID=UPI001F5E4206|nr:SUMF1/EgtB/PvdO family nonheme iron enzyme [Corallococcus exiguus]